MRNPIGLSDASTLTSISSAPISSSISSSTSCLFVSSAVREGPHRRFDPPPLCSVGSSRRRLPKSPSPDPIFPQGPTRLSVAKWMGAGCVSDPQCRSAVITPSTQAPDASVKMIHTSARHASSPPPSSGARYNAASCVARERPASPMVTAQNGMEKRYVQALETRRTRVMQTMRKTRATKKSPAVTRPPPWSSCRSHNSALAAAATDGGPMITSHIGARGAATAGRRLRWRRMHTGKVTSHNRVPIAQQAREKSRYPPPRDPHARGTATSPMTGTNRDRGE
mmetsp:Transcript_55709/g.131539  ORF Transcript_55709/g.131539 Transcript_55709/m.131539 type:complete len:281 (+) Transcript_55709:115-957(+)